MKISSINSRHPNNNNTKSYNPKVNDFKTLPETPISETDRSKTKTIIGLPIRELTALSGIYFGIRKLKPVTIIKTTEDKTIQANWRLSEKEISEITVRPNDNFKINIALNNRLIQSNDINEVMDEILKSVSPRCENVDKNIAKEVLPILIKNDVNLKIGGHYERFLSSINEENKDFAMSRTIPWMVENYGKSGLPYNYNNYHFLYKLQPDNIDAATKLAKVSKELGLNNNEEFFKIIGHVSKMNEKFVFEEAIPTILKNKDTLLNPKGESITELIEMLTPKNIKTVFYDYLPAVLEHKETLNLGKDSGYTVVSVLNSINKNGKNFILNKALPIITENAEKLKITDTYDLQYLLEEITPQNKNNLNLIAKNAEKLEIEKRADACRILRNKNKKEIQEMINK